MKPTKIVNVSADELIYLIKEKYGNVDVKFNIKEIRIPVSTSNSNHCITGQIFDGAELIVKS